MVRWPAIEGRQSVLFLNGRADFIEKYSEAYWHWRDRGFGILTFDWRGQGLSGRLPADAAGCFETWIEDLAAIAEHAAAEFGEFVVAGHSMGGHLALRMLSEGKAPSRLSRAVLFAPMADIASHGVPAGLLKLLASVQVSRGRGFRYPPGQGPYGKRHQSPRRQKLLTGDMARFADEAWWTGASPGLALGGATWSWLHEAFASCAALARAGAPESIAVPVDAFMGTSEALVDAAAARQIIARVPNGRWHDVASSAHEILREVGDIQDRVHSVVDTLIGARSQ